MDFYSWLMGCGKATMDSDQEFEEKHPRQEGAEGQTGNGRFRTSNKSLGLQDDVSVAKPQVGGKQTSEVSDATYDELYEIYESDGVTDELIEKADALLDGIISGKVKARRLPSCVFSMIPKNTPTWMLYAYLTMSGADRDGPFTEGAIDFNKQIEQQNRQKPILYDFAESAGMVEDSGCLARMKDTMPHLDGGTESEVFIESDETVLKLSSLRIGGYTPAQKIERLLLSAIKHPESAYEVVGMAQPDGYTFSARENELVFKLRQRKFDLEEDPPTDDQIWDYEIEQGFPRGVWHINAFIEESGRLIDYDCHNENVQRTTSGELVNLDPCVMPNAQSRYGGTYDYLNPPDTI